MRPSGLVVVIGTTCSLVTAPLAADDPAPDPPRRDVYASKEGIPPPSLDAADLDLGGNERPQDLYLEVYVGDRSTGRIAHVQRRNGGLWTTGEELEALGFVVPPGAERAAGGWIALAALPGLEYRYNVESQTLHLRSPPVLRRAQRLGYEPPDAVEAHRDTGWLLSYDAYGRKLDGDEALGVTSSLRWFGGAGALDLVGVSRAGDAATGYQRLETRWTYSDPERLWTWTGGDLISGGLAWTRPVRIGGLQWRRNFGVRPDLITLPMPRFSADATVPSSIELYVNNVRQFGSEVQEGPFVVQALPRISGSGQATLIVTDALGRVTETSVPLYIDHQRLARGLTDFSFEAGVLRLGFGGTDDEYGDDPVASASLRHGVTNTLTLEGHGEAGPGLRLAGVGAVWSPANRWGLISASYAHSDGDTRGGQHALGYQWNASGYGFDVQTLRRGDGYHDLGDLHSESAAALPGLRRQDRATAWLPVDRGSVGLTWLRWFDRDGADHRTRSLSWTQTVAGRLSVTASLFDDEDGGRGGGLTVSVPLGPRLHAGASIQRSRGESSGYATLRRSAPYDGGWGWRVEAGELPGSYVQASAELRGRYGAAELGIDRRDERTGGFFQGNGSLALMDGQLFLSRRIYDAFAVVSTNGRGGVPVLSENRLYGRTASDGYLLIPELRGWQDNRLAIDPDELGPDYRVEDLETTVTPADRSGVLVEFDVAHVQPAILVLLGPRGEPVPAGTRGRLVKSGRPIIVGFDGEAYVEDVTRNDRIELAVDGVRCHYRVPAHDEHPEAVIRATLACERSSP